MKSDIYKINNMVEKIKVEKHTYFLDRKDLKEVTSKLKSNEYNIYYPYPDGEKVILYTKKIPKIKLYRIIATEKLRHQDVLGSLFSLNIDSSCFGDVVFYEDSYYVFIIDELEKYIKNNLNMIGKNKVSLEEVNIDALKNYKRSYEQHEIIISSIRIDNVVAAIINSSRSKALEKIKNKEVIVNYDIISKGSYLLKENDVFSIRKYGKYKFVGIIKNTKKDNYVVRYLKYI